MQVDELMEHAATLAAEVERLRLHINRKDTRVKTLEECLKPAYVEPAADGVSDLVMTKYVKDHVFALRDKIAKYEATLETISCFWTWRYDGESSNPVRTEPARLARNVLDELGGVKG
jgi:hypothetical protein